MVVLACSNSIAKSWIGEVVEKIVRQRDAMCTECV